MTQDFTHWTWDGLAYISSGSANRELATLAAYQAIADFAKQSPLSGDIFLWTDTPKPVALGKLLALHPEIQDALGDRVQILPLPPPGHRRPFQQPMALGVLDAADTEAAIEKYGPEMEEAKQRTLLMPMKGFDGEQPPTLFCCNPVEPDIATTVEILAHNRAHKPPKGEIPYRTAAPAIARPGKAEPESILAAPPTHKVYLEICLNVAIQPAQVKSADIVGDLPVHRLGQTFQYITLSQTLGSSVQDARDRLLRELAQPRYPYSWVIPYLGASTQALIHKNKLPNQAQPASPSKNKILPSPLKSELQMLLWDVAPDVSHHTIPLAEPAPPPPLPSTQPQPLPSKQNAFTRLKNLARLKRDKTP